MDSKTLINLLTTKFARVSETVIEVMPIYEIAQAIHFVAKGGVVMGGPSPKLSVDHSFLPVPVPPSDAFEKVRLIMYIAGSGTLRNNNKNTMS